MSTLPGSWSSVTLQEMLPLSSAAQTLGSHCHQEHQVWKGLQFYVGSS